MSDRERIEQSNDVAGIVIDVMERKHGTFAYLDLRYDIADAVYDAGYRKRPDDADQWRKRAEAAEARLEAARAVPFTPDNPELALRRFIEALEF